MQPDASDTSLHIIHRACDSKDKVRSKATTDRAGRILARGRKVEVFVAAESIIEDMHKIAVDGGDRL